MSESEGFYFKKSFVLVLLNIFKMRYQREFVKNVEAIQEKYDSAEGDETGTHLFTILITVISLRHIDNAEINVSLLDGLTKTIQLTSTQELWHKYTRNLLLDLNKDPKAWLAVTTERCIFETVLLESGTLANKSFASFFTKKNRFQGRPLGKIWISSLIFLQKVWTQKLMRKHV